MNKKEKAAKRKEIKDFMYYLIMKERSEMLMRYYELHNGGVTTNIRSYGNRNY